MSVKLLNSIMRIAARTLARSRKSGIQAVIIIVLIFGLGVGALPVRAASVTWDGDDGDGLWSTPENWSGDTLPQTGNYISISGSAGEVILDTDFTLVGKLTVNGEGNTLRIGSGVTLTLDPDLAPGQYDTVIVDNGGTLINDGIVAGTILSPLPRIFVTSAGSTDESTLINNSTMTVVGVYLRGGTTVAPYPTLINNGTMNTVRVSTLAGTINNSGLIDDAQISLQLGIVNNEVGGTINTSFTLSSMGSRFIKSTVFDNYGTVTNEASINNEGIFNNYGTFDNTGGTFTNTCDFGNGTIGIFNNFGVFLGNPISNEGSLWDNDSGNGLWSDPLNWTNDVLPTSTGDIIINVLDGADTTVTVNVNITIDGRLAIRNSDGPPITSTLLIPGGVTLTNNGSITPGSDTTINNQGSIINNGEIRAAGSASFINAGSFSGNPVVGISSTWDGDDGDGLWSTPENWSGDTLPQTGNYISISGSAGEVILDTDFTLVGKLTVNGEGNTLRIGSGVTLTLDPDLAPGQYDTVIVDNGGTLINDGIVAGTILSPLPRIFVTSAGSTDESTLINNSTMTVVGVYLRGGTTVAPYPTLINNGTMNTVRVSTLAGTINNSGLIDDAQISLQLGIVNNEVGGTINTSFTLSSMGSRFIKSTVFDNYGTVTNEASINNEGIFNNYGTFDNTGGTFNNQGTFNSQCGSTLLGTISGNPVNEIPCNTAPVVDAGENQTVNEGDPVSLDPATFTDADVTDSHTATISWGDTSPTEPGVVIESAGSGTVSGTHTYTDDGIYTVTVWVADDEVESSSSLTVTVQNVAPIANAGADQAVDEGNTVDFSGSFIDPGTGDTHTITWNFGDGSPSVSGTLTPSHTYAVDVVYQATLTVTDDDLGIGSDMLTVTVNDLGPTAALTGDATLDEGQVGNYDASASTSSPDAIASYEWDWDYDGTNFNPSGDSGVTQTHAWADDGTYTVAVRVTDDDGSTDIATFSVTVGNLPPQVNAGPNQTVNLGDTASVEAEFTDPGILDTHTATILWGDGDSEPGVVNESAGSGTVTGSHVYAWPGIYEVTVEVSDDDSMDGDTLTVEVLPVAEVMVETLSDDIDAMDLQSATKNSLNASLDAAIKKLEDSNPKNDVAAINNLEAFINKIEAQRGKKIPSEVADALIAKAQDIIAALSGGA